MLKSFLIGILHWEILELNGAGHIVGCTTKFLLTTKDTERINTEFTIRVLGAYLLGALCGEYLARRVNRKFVGHRYSYLS